MLLIEITTKIHQKSTIFEGIYEGLIWLLVRKMLNKTIYNILVNKFTS